MITSEGTVLNAFIHPSQHLPPWLKEEGMNRQRKILDVENGILIFAPANTKNWFLRVNKNNSLSII